MIELKNISDCCGCTACFSVCPSDAIIMKPDNEGFLYPYINKDKCINCQLCEKVCPILNPQKEEKKEQTAYLFQNSNAVIRKESTSGGAFSAIAEFFLKHGGVVVGAAYDKKFRIQHIIIDDESDLYKFRNSKYAQSDLKDVFKKGEKAVGFKCFSLF